MSSSTVPSTGAARRSGGPTAPGLAAGLIEIVDAGTEVCRVIGSRSAVPVIMLTAKDSEVDKVVGLELGADDYVTKPFSHCELVTRMRAVLRRQTADAEDPAVLESGPVRARAELIARVWGANYVGDTKTLDVHVKRLRTKIEPDPGSPRYLVTVRGLGYQFSSALAHA